MLGELALQASSTPQNPCGKPLEMIAHIETGVSNRERESGGLIERARCTRHYCIQGFWPRPEETLRVCW
jgi:hypothetical protein